MRSTRIRRALLAAVTATATIIPLAVSTATASAATISPDAPGGVAAPHSPDGVPSNGTGPMYRTWPIASSYSHQHPGANPRGANDFTCRPTPGTRPVVLVPGTGEDAFATWSYYAPMLHDAGLCVFTFNYNIMTSPDREWAATTGDIRSTAAFLAHFVDKVRTATGSDRVDLVGHSQGGGPLPRAYIKWYGGDRAVNHLIGLVPSNKGTTVYGLATLIGLDRPGSLSVTALQDYADKHNYESLPQQLAGSSFLGELNDGGMTAAGVRYTVISTRYDDVVTPYTNAFIHEDGVTNITMQSVCAKDHTDHFGFTYDPVAFQVVLNALLPDRATKVTCVYVPGYIQ
ncbi:esterase/lipase family protein [Acidipropionibacterium timonense]|uniref:esterase/lipase family protein n=1 Tax=Acidipropionibacterium timonense TaxID=2161818 RepID=UPI00103221F5|nr:triacylglycerol lipase [Acidipropionibacterium timonense]